MTSQTEERRTERVRGRTDTYL